MPVGRNPISSYVRALHYLFKVQPVRCLCIHDTWHAAVQPHNE